MIGERLRELRKEKRLKQEDIAAVIGVNKSAISYYETDRYEPSDKIKVELAKFFNTSLDYLMGIVDEAVPYYDKERFLILPDDISEEEKAYLLEFIGYLEYKKKPG